MILYPSIELQNDHCVSLHRGRLEEAQLWHVDPVKKALAFVEAGASWLHITDFDALAGGGGHSALIREILRKAGVPAMVGGGIRGREAAKRWIDLGAARVVIGTLAARDPELIEALAYQYPDQIVLAVDVWRGRVMTDGWRNATAYTPKAFVEAFEGLPLAAFLVTDIESDIGETDAELGMVSGLAARTRTPVIASGLVRTLDDISRLKYVRNVHGAVIGRALFNKTVALPEALALAEAPTEPAADFI